MDDGFQTRCPKCGGQLYVTYGQFYTRIPLFVDGFSTLDAQWFDTSDERVECGNSGCDYVGPLTFNSPVGPVSEGTPPKRIRSE